MQDFYPPRKIDYLRLSLTDRCNLRCIYCMPREGIESVPHGEILTYEEIVRVARIFTGLGIKRIRLTGGEPLIRKGVPGLVRSLSQISGLEEISLTTNGLLLSDFARELKQVGVSRINISLDTLNEEKFLKITGSSEFSRAVDGIDKAREAGFSPLKLNVVAMKGINDDEIHDFVEFSLSRGLTLRFIEFMKITPLWTEDRFIPIEEVKRICGRRFAMDKIDESGPGPAEYYRLAGAAIGFIKTDVGNCLSCGRLRLTSTGKLKICLYEPQGLSLKEALRGSVPDAEIAGLIRERVCQKSSVDYRNWQPCQVFMSSVGG